MHNVNQLHKHHPLNELNSRFQNPKSSHFYHTILFFCRSTFFPIVILKNLLKVQKKDILYNTLFEFLYFTGVRKGELLALNWNDLNKRYIYINKTITKELFDGERLITDPKTKTSVRTIKLDLKTYIKLLKLKKYYIKNDKSFNNNYFMFGGSKPIATTTLDRKKNYYFDKANVKRVRIHDFRHSHATLLYKSKCDIKLIQQSIIGI